jgi:uncharacterized protein
VKQVPLLTKIHTNRGLQIVLGLLFGIVFGFLLQKGGVTNYGVIEGQLLLVDFTVLKVMLSAVIVGMIGYHLLKHAGYVQSHAAEGSIGSNVVGGLIFGVGFALLGYCPGTVAGAVGTGAVDALIGGFGGLLLGVAIFVEVFPRIKGILSRWPLPVVTVPELLRLDQLATVVVMEIVMIGFLGFLAWLGY